MNFNILSVSYIDNREFSGEDTAPPGPFGYQQVMDPKALIRRDVVADDTFRIENTTSLNRGEVIALSVPWIHLGTSKILNRWTLSSNLSGTTLPQRSSETSMAPNSHITIYVR